ncbi:MAG TPA: hypothetical protein VMS31_23075 [Pyrinomonadaceae bacterium]|nr:hypothetical protein [Pyrinomonadaceae bacterium]
MVHRKSVSIAALLSATLFDLAGARSRLLAAAIALPGVAAPAYSASILRGVSQSLWRSSTPKLPSIRFAPLARVVISGDRGIAGAAQYS